AGAVLVPFVVVRRGVRAVRPALAPGTFVGVVGMAIPFLLISWGETHVDSGVAAVANSSVPIFVALLALRFAASERSNGPRMLGLAVGLAGVGVVAGVHPNGGWWAVAGALAVVLASLCYAVSSLFIQRSLVVGGLELATASVLCGAVAMLPFALADLPDSVGWKPLASVVVLGVVGTGIAQLIVNRLIGEHGPARSMLVNYLLPRPSRSSTARRSSASRSRLRRWVAWRSSSSGSRLRRGWWPPETGPRPPSRSPDWSRYIAARACSRRVHQRRFAHPRPHRSCNRRGRVARQAAPLGWRRRTSPVRVRA
ncbi:MAG: DMT family transporter, partial [Actinobacteria bacterium]